LIVTKGSQWNAELYDDKHSFVWKMAAGVLELLEAKSESVSWIWGAVPVI